MSPEPDAPKAPEPDRSPSLRRVLNGYLRLRSPQNLCIDGGLAVVAAYLLGVVLAWFHSPWELATTEVSRGRWALEEAFRIATGCTHYAGIGLFLFGCARLIADRIGKASSAE